MSGTAIADGQALLALAAPVRERATGILSATRGRLKRLFCFEKGRLVFATSNVIEEQFDEYLVRSRLLTPRQRAEAKVHAAKAELPLPRYLAEHPPIPLEQLREAAERRVLELLDASLGAPSTEFAFSPGKPRLDDQMTVDLAAAGIVLDRAAGSSVPLDQVRIAIGPPATRPELPPDGGGDLRDVGLSEVAAELLQRSDGSLEVGALVERCAEQAEPAWRTLWGLLLVGALVPARTEEARTVGHDRVTREECLARLHGADGADHYALLGLEADADSDEIRSAYYVLARRYHPDRFRTGDLKDLLPGIERFFTQVTEAYNSLNDRERRAAYDEELGSRRGGKQKTAPENEPTYLARQNYLRARVLIEKRRFADAVTFLENALQLVDDVADYHFELGRLLAQNPRRRADAESGLRRSLEIDPTRIDARIELSRLFQKTDRLEEAVRMAEEALRWGPGNAEARKLAEEIGKAGGGGRRGGLFSG